MAERSGLDDVIQANKGFEQRVEKQDVTVSYDPEFDIFLLRFGEARPAITEEIEDGFNLRVDPTTLEILAFEVLGFRRRFLKKHPEFMGLYGLLFESEPLVKRRLPSGDQRRSGPLADLFPLGAITAPA